MIVAHSSLETAAEKSPYRLGAPATEVLTTTPDASYAFLSGNSLAAAHTTGVVALLMEREPTLDVERITALLSGTMTSAVGYQSINACRALDRLTGNELCSRAAELATPSLVYPGSQFASATTLACNERRLRCRGTHTSR